MKRLNLFLLVFVIIVFFSSIVIFKKESEKKPSHLNTPFAKEKVKTFQIEPRLSINEIFSQNHQWIKTIPSDRIVTVIATGDIIPARAVNFQSVARNNFKWAFEKTASFLRNADITLINFESPLIKNCNLTNTGMIFCGSEHHIEGLLFAGIDVANLANNHSANYGAEGIKNTVELLNRNGIITTGVNGAAFKEVKGVKFAFLGYNDILGGFIVNSNQIKSEIKDAKNKADVVVVSFHFGDEYTPQPNRRQKELAHLAVDNGADLIIGNHPHWIQPVEIYKEKFITFAHGNFIFDQMWSEKTKEGVIGKYIFSGKNLVDVEFIPIKIANYGQAYFPEGSEKERILKEMEKESLKLLKL